MLEENKSQKGQPLETEDTQNHENRGLRLIESLHMQHCSLRGCIRPLVPAKAVINFKTSIKGMYFEQEISNNSIEYCMALQLNYMFLSDKHIYVVIK